VSNKFLKRWQFWVGLLIGGLFLYFALQGLHLADVWAVMQGADLIWLLPGIAVYFVAVWARAWRWHYLLKPIKPISTNAMFPIVTIGYMGNNILPARAGEVLRAFVLRKKQGVPVSASLATILVERIFDGVVMLMFVIFNLDGLTQLSHDSGFVGSIRSVALIGTAAFAVALVFFLLAAAFPHQSLGLYHRWVALRLPKAIESRLTPMLDSFWHGLESLRSPLNVLMVFATSVVIWLFETAKYWFVMHAFDFSLYQGGFFGLMLMNGVVNLATTLPGPPGHVGTFDGPGIAVLVAYGLPREIAVGYTLTLHAALWLPITLLGAWYMAREGLKWNQVQAEYQELDRREEVSYGSPG
jgi:hypothetical protein